MLNKLQKKPSYLNFLSGPGAKLSGWSIDVLKNSNIGRSHRSKNSKEKINEIIIKSKQRLDWGFHNLKNYD